LTRQLFGHQLHCKATPTADIGSFITTEAEIHTAHNKIEEQNRVHNVITRTQDAQQFEKQS
jgi:hypothetical protein